MPSPRRFPPPRSIEEQNACFIARDTTSQAKRTHKADMSAAAVLGALSRGVFGVG